MGILEKIAEIENEVQFYSFSSNKRRYMENLMNYISLNVVHRRFVGFDTI